MSKTLQNGSFQLADGSAVNAGRLLLTLSQDAKIIAGGQVAPRSVSVALTSTGNISGVFSVLGNDELSPGGTFYWVEVQDSNGNIVYGPVKWVLSGASPIDLNGMTPTLADPSWASPVLLNPTAAQTIATYPLNVRTLNNIRFADQFATGSSTGGIQEAYNDGPAAGVHVKLPPNYTATLTVGVTTTSTKPLYLEGSGTTSIISGSGITLLTIVAPDSYVSNLRIQDPTGNASTIGIDINNGATSVNHWRVSNVTLMGTSKLGTGIRTVFGLIGVVEKCNIRGWTNGISLTASGSFRSNANEFRGNDITLNTTGVNFNTAGVDDVFFFGNTIESNDTGISGSPAGTVTFVANHFENTTGATPTNISIGATGVLVSIGNLYTGGSANRDIIITSGNASGHLSVGDQLPNGITHNGSGTFVFLQPTGANPKAGTGAISQILQTSIAATNGTGNPLSFTGFQSYSFDQVVDATLFRSKSANPAASGTFRIASSDTINFRNNANTADLNGVSKDASDVVRVGDAAGVRLGASGATPILNHLSATATLNFAAPAAVPGSVDLTITVTGAAIGDTVTVGSPVTVGANYILTAFVSAANTVTVRWTQIAGAAADPDGAGGTYRVDIWKH